MKKTLFLTSVGALAFALVASTAFAAPLTRQLDFGMTNSDVTSLQTFLATDATIYPQGLITGYFGFLTKAAVSNFQSRNGIDAVGRVGPVTLAAINAQMAGGTSMTTTDTVEGAGKVTNIGSIQPRLSNIAVTSTNNSSTITWNSTVAGAAKVYYSTQWPFVYNTAATVAGNNGTTNQTVTINGLQANTTYYYTVETLDSLGNFSWSTNGASFKTQN